MAQSKGAKGMSARGGKGDNAPAISKVKPREGSVAKPSSKKTRVYKNNNYWDDGNHDSNFDDAGNYVPPDSDD